jgi:hypothetical protein
MQPVETMHDSKFGSRSWAREVVDAASAGAQNRSLAFRAADRGGRSSLCAQQSRVMSAPSKGRSRRVNSPILVCRGKEAAHRPLMRKFHQRLSLSTAAIITLASKAGV